MRRGLLVVTLLTASAFGPYVLPGLRTEQVIVYAVAAVTVPLGLLFTRPRGSTALLVAWVTLVVTAAFGVLEPVQGLARWPQGNAVAGLDNLLLPLAVAATALVLLAWGGDRIRLLRRVSAVLVLAMLVNVVAAILQGRGAVFGAWIPDERTSVSARAAAQFRYSGLINQPAEAGLLYGLALMAAAYLLWRRPVLLLVVAAVLSYGGVLTVSKVFLLVALPIFGWRVLSLRDRGSAGRIGAVLVATFVGLGAYSQGLLPKWEGLDQLVEIVPGLGESAVSSLTASRLGESSTLAPVVREVLAVSPLTGFGAQGLEAPYDNAWVEALVVAGLVGALAYTLALVAAWRAWRVQPRSAERTYLGSALVLLVGASMGLPALTANRAATVVWLLLILLLAESSRDVRQRLPRAGGAGRDAHPPQGRTRGRRRVEHDVASLPGAGRGGGSGSR